MLTYLNMKVFHSLVNFFWNIGIYSQLSNHEFTLYEIIHLTYLGLCSI